MLSAAVLPVWSGCQFCRRGRQTTMMLEPPAASFVFHLGLLRFGLYLMKW